MEKCGSVTTVAILEVLTAVILEFQDFWSVTLRILNNSYRHFTLLALHIP
jgi:hypothetical protein